MTSEDPKTCPTCGGAVRQRGSRTVCPRCLLAGTVEESASEISANHPPVRIEAPDIETLAPDFPDLQIIRLVGIGGIAIVPVGESGIDRRGGIGQGMIRGAVCVNQCF